MKYFLFLVMLVGFGKCYGKSILWDIDHWSDTPWRVGKYSSLVSLLGSNGYTVDTTYTVTSKNLLNYDVIVISIRGNLYTSEEADSLESYQQTKNGCVLLTADANFLDDTYIKQENKDFAIEAFDCVSQNGGIIIMSDYQSYANIRPVTQRFHMDVGLSTISPSDLWFDSLDYSYCFFTGIDSLYFRAAGELSATSPAKIIGWAPTGEPTLACFNCDHCTSVNERTNSTQKLLRATPNPFTQKIVIRYSLNENRNDCRVNDSRLTIHDIAGRLIRTLPIHDSRLTIHEVVWDGKDLNSNETSHGVYFLRAKDCKALKVIKLGN